MSGRSLSADKEVAGTTCSASGPDDAQSSQLPDRQRRRLSVVDTHNLGRVLCQAEIQVGDSPGFFFATMPTPRTPKLPKSGEKAKLPSAASARKTRAKAAKKAAEEAAARAKPPDQAGFTPPDQAGVTPPDQITRRYTVAHRIVTNFDHIVTNLIKFVTIFFIKLILPTF
jgi:hypothetical protein